MNEPEPGCYACRLLRGDEPLPGGRLHQTRSWVVEHCTGPLGVGTLIVKPLRHFTRLSELTHDEATELGPLLAEVASVVQELTRADQVYSCLWSHAGWQPGHIHFVMQPVWNRSREEFERPGPALQADMFVRNSPLPLAEVTELCVRARECFRSREG